MKAMVQRRYGPPGVLELREIENPVMTDDSVLVRVRAVSVNPLDVYSVSGPYLFRLGSGLRRPKRKVQGVDFAGTIEAVGRNATRFRVGDPVFGAGTSAFAEYVCLPANGTLALQPANLSFEQAAAVPVAGLTALQALRDKGRVQRGQNVLINGASGGVGTFAVQIAKSFGAEVTGVCSTANVEMVRSIGADRVIDYTREDFARGGRNYDLMIDIAGSRSWRDCRRALAHDARYIMVGAAGKNRWIGPLGHIAGQRLASIRAPQRVEFFVARLNPEDLVALRELMLSGRVRPLIDRTYPFVETATALAYLAAGHARGKVIITV